MTVWVLGFQVIFWREKGWRRRYSARRLRPGAVVGGDGFFAIVVDVEAGVFPGEQVGEFSGADELGFARGVKEKQDARQKRKSASRGALAATLIETTLQAIHSCGTEARR
jgi:hypothetical protein